MILGRYSEKEERNGDTEKGLGTRAEEVEKIFMYTYMVCILKRTSYRFTKEG